MKMTLVSCALIAGIAAAAIASPSQFSKVRQQLTEMAPAVAERPAEPFEADQDITASIGEGFSCEQIRIMDEVEFIADDSYCGERG